MGETGSDRYDVVIIGAGIGGLVCGCYLAKAGMKVLIVEQHHKPGGYCTSFKRQGFSFNAAPHCFGSYGKERLTRRIFEDLKIDQKINIIRSEPSDVIITPDIKIHIWNDFEKTICELQTAFPHEADNIRNFYSFLLGSDINAFSRIRRWTFKDLLNQYFHSEEIKSILAIPLLASHGLPSSLISAFMGCKIFSEFLLDGGYHPVGGMQALPNALVDIFKEFGGDLQLSALVKKILIEDNRAVGILLENGDIRKSIYVVSASDCRKTFYELIEKENIEKGFAHKIEEMMPSLSTFILYLGMNEHFETSLTPGTAYCICPHYDLESIYLAARENHFGMQMPYTIRISHDKSTVNVYMLADYGNNYDWKNNKVKIMELLLKKIEKQIPNVSKYIMFKDAATPYTLQRYTLNYKGASFGWACLPSQFADHDFRKPSFIHNLYLTGHWTTFGVGISGVAYFGADTAKIILKKEKSRLNA